jgi:hypothetical protein
MAYSFLAAIAALAGITALKVGIRGCVPYNSKTIEIHDHISSLDIVLGVFIVLVGKQFREVVI